MKKTLFLGVFFIGIFAMVGYLTKQNTTHIKQVLIHPYPLNKSLNSESLILYQGNPNLLLWEMATVLKDSLNKNPNIQARLSRESANAAFSEEKLLESATQKATDLILVLSLNTEIGTGFKVYYQHEGKAHLSEEERQLLLAKSFAASEQMQKALKRNISGYIVDNGLMPSDVKQKGTHLLDVSNAETPVVNVELGNLTEQIDALFLESKMGKARIATALKDGTERYLRME